MRPRWLDPWALHYRFRWENVNLYNNQYNQVKKKLKIKDLYNVIVLIIVQVDCFPSFAHFHTLHNIGPLWQGRYHCFTRKDPPLKEAWLLEIIGYSDDACTRRPRIL